MAADEYFRRGITPKSIIQHGAQALTIVMSQDVTVKITDGYHSIALDEIAKLPDQISRPVMLFAGSQSDSFVVLVEMTDKAGDEVAVAIHLSKYQKRMRVNRIASLCGKKNV